MLVGRCQDLHWVNDSIHCFETFSSRCPNKLRDVCQYCVLSENIKFKKYNTRHASIPIISEGFNVRVVNPGIQCIERHFYEGCRR